MSTSWGYREEIWGTSDFAHLTFDIRPQTRSWYLIEKYILASTCLGHEGLVEDGGHQVVRQVEGDQGLVELEAVIDPGEPDTDDEHSACDWLH